MLYYVMPLLLTCDIANAIAHVGRSPKGRWDRPSKIFLG